MSSKRNWFSFGDLKVGETFVFHNPYINTTLVRDYLLKKISARKYTVVAGEGLGNEYQSSVKVGVALI
jgi:hypothetical protein